MEYMDQSNLEVMRHSCEHILTQAMIKLYPGIKMAMGPATNEGFYFDFEYDGKISEGDFPKIEKEMAHIVKKNLSITQKTVPIAESRALFKGNPYKQEWLDEIEKKGEKVSVYWTGEEFIDLCSGPHVASTGKVGPFKLLTVAGAYWRGDSKNKMLTRIYGTCFPTKEELDKFLWRIEEAKKRDHKKLGKELGFYLITEDVGPGLILWKPKGAVIRRIMENFIIEEQIKRGYKMVFSPHIGKKQLWVTSGHWDLYRDKMYSPMKVDNEEYMVKPMNCPMHMMLYRSEMHSWRELPLRIAENATVYRYEQAGELSGMVRARYLTQDDSHIFCSEEQVTQEFINVMDYAFYFLKAFEINDYYMQLSIRDPNNKNKYLGSDEIWLNAEQKIKDAVKKKNAPFIVKEGEAAFYGPKLDFMIKDSLGREWQCGTIQIDFMLPERFKLEYTDSTGSKRRPVVIHRAIAGSLERFFAILVEHYAGAFPLWLAPVQIDVLPVTDNHLEFAQKIKTHLLKMGFRVEVDTGNETLGKKIRHSILQKVPYMVIIGDKELEKSKDDDLFVSVRTREGKDLGVLDIQTFIKKLEESIEKRPL